MHRNTYTTHSVYLMTLRGFHWYFPVSKTILIQILPPRSGHYCEVLKILDTQLYYQPVNEVSDINIPLTMKNTLWQESNLKKVYINNGITYFIKWDIIIIVMRYPSCLSPPQLTFRFSYILLWLHTWTSWFSYNSWWFILLHIWFFYCLL